MLNITITDSRPATECDQCDSAYRQQYGCNQDGSSTEIMVCQIEHVKWRHESEQENTRQDVG